MKTSEFIKKVDALRYEVIEIDDVIKVKTYFGKDCAQLCTVNKLFMLNTENSELAKLVIEYIETPIHEREDEKKYRVRIPDSPERTPVYALCKLVNGCVVINQTNESNFKEHDRYILTESEIKKNHAYLWQFAKEI